MIQRLLVALALVSSACGGSAPPAPARAEPEPAVAEGPECRAGRCDPGDSCDTCASSPSCPTCDVCVAMCTAPDGTTYPPR
ncbi:MAG: hypothetical protein KF729_10400 [Sandaracinaceae bacterium]|nr:hypothetical protein [Sandaracinaceae bacterium]